MKKYVLRFFCILLLVSLLGAMDVQASAAEYESVYYNSTTGFRAVIVDDGDLLTPEYEEKLILPLADFTDYGNIAVYTVTDGVSSNASENARLKRKELFEYTDASVFMIDLQNRKIYIQSYGAMYKVFTNAQATSITNNVAHYATAGLYGNCAYFGIRQMVDKLEGSYVPSPMKYLSNACIGLALAMLVIFRLVRRDMTTVIRPSTDQWTPFIGASWELSPFERGKVVVTRVYSPPSDVGVDSGGGGCGGGGGGGCGGGGGSSF